MPTNPYLDADYKEEFINDQSINKNALQQALDIRKFEIELYWKRAAYFWTFIAATFGGFIAVQSSGEGKNVDMLILLSCLGIVFSFAWLCVNRGSKYWQENWEYHVDMLEDKINGPLYKVVMSRSEPSGFNESFIHALTGPSAISVSKINQLISLFVTIIWVVLLFYSLPEFSREKDVNWFYINMISVSLLACIGFLYLGRTYGGGYWHKATKRTASIKKEEENG